MQEKVKIKNRKDQTMVVVLNISNNQKGLAFVMHGLGGNKDQSHIQTFAKAFEENDFTVILFDSTNTFGESDGDYADATTTNYYEDLEDVINWGKTQKWYQKPFWLAGHSLGGISTALYAERHPEEVKALAPISTVISGALSLESPQYKDNDMLEKWERTGIRETPSESKPGLMKRLKWSHVIDRAKYDLLSDVAKLTMPTLMIVGDQDDSTPPAHQKILFENLPGKKEFHIIKNAPHTFKTPEHLAEIKDIFDKWIKNNL